MLEFIAGTFTVLSSGQKCSLEVGEWADLLQQNGAVEAPATRETRRTRIKIPAFESTATWMNIIDVLSFFFSKRGSIYLAFVSTVLTFL